MRYRTFVTYNVLGGVLWAVGVTALGHYLGQVTFIRDNIEYAIVVLIAISLVPAVVEIRRARPRFGRCGARTVGVRVTGTTSARGAALVADRSGRPARR